MLTQKKDEEGASLPLFIITLGSATIDFVAYNNHTPITIPNFTKQHADSIQYCLGGGAINAALTFVQQACKVAPISVIGNDPWALILRKTLESQGVITDQLISKPINTRISLIFPNQGQETSVITSGTPEHAIDIQNIDFNLIAQADVLYISSLALTNPYDLVTLIHHAYASKTMIAFNPGKHNIIQHQDILKEILPYIDIFICNKHEAELFLIPTSPHNNLATLQDLGVTIAIITCDKNGAYVGYNNHIVYQSAYATKLINTTGAGDAFGATFVATYIKTSSIEQALDQALFAASKIVASYSSSMHSDFNSTLIDQENA